MKLKPEIYMEWAKPETERNWMLVILCTLPAAAQRRPTAPLQCCFLCKSDSTPTAGGTSAAHSAPCTSSPAALQRSGQWTRPCPDHNIDKAGIRGRGRGQDRGEWGAVYMTATWGQYPQRVWKTFWLKIDRVVQFFIHEGILMCRF